MYRHMINIDNIVVQLHIYFTNIVSTLPACIVFPSQFSKPKRLLISPNPPPELKQGSVHVICPGVVAWINNIKLHFKGDSPGG